MNRDQAKEFIDERQRLGRDFVDAGRRQGAWAGIERLVTDELYPDQSHFIYELLQNAEDAGATRIRFELNAEVLTVTHNGNRLFSRDDVTGITSIGQSQKREEVNKIGKFGVGFKSVFAYTKAPRIMSGVFCFSISDLVVPAWTGQKNGTDSNETAFILPFDRESKLPSQCFKEIAAGLDSLPASTILFLRSLNEISWVISGDRNGYIRKERADAILPVQDSLYRVVRITCQASDGKLDATLWLRFEAPLRERNDLTCSIAFLLSAKPRKDADAEQEELPGSESHSNSVSILPLPEPGLLHIYFPAGKEPTGLLFHIHAPFAATVDRASIPFEHEGNRSLMEQLAQLSKVALATIKNLGLLQPAFLGVLPHGRDELHEFYRPMREEIVSAFQMEEFLPTHHGGYAKATDVIYGPRELRVFFLDENLKKLFAMPRAVWCPGFMNSSRPYFFLDTLDVREIGWDEFIDAWDKTMGGETSNPQDKIQFEDWIRTMAAHSGNRADWFRGLYRVLLKADKETRKNAWSTTDQRIKRSPVVWTENDALLKGGEVYLEKGTQIIPGISVETIHPDLLKFEQRGALEKEKETRAALSMLGVLEYDEQAAISAFVKKISTQKTIEISIHLEQLRCLLAWHKEGEISDLSELEKACLFLDEDQKFYRTPSKFYLDDPFRSTGLSAFYEGDENTHALWPGYAKEFNPDDFADFAEEVGVHVDLPFIEKKIDWQHPERFRLCDGWGAVRRTYSETNVDWVIENLETVIQRQNAETNRALWNRLCEIQARHFYARYAPNSSHYSKTGHSSFVHQLRTMKWVQNKAGDFTAPEDLDASSIAEGWNLVASNGWLDVSGFGSKAENEAEVKRDRTEVAEKLGVNPELVEVLRTMPLEKQEELLRRIQDPPDLGEFPEDEEVNVERRTKKAEQRVKESESVNREPRTRSVRTSGNREAVRVYLTERYSRDGHLYCQMSHQPMPFRLPDGRPYFEAVEIFQLDSEIEANHLCLSPTCAAEFRHALEDSEEELRERILEVDSEADGLEVTVNVPLDEHSVIRFTKRHLIDLKAALNIKQLEEEAEGSE